MSVATVPNRRLAEIADPKGEGARACLTVYADAARAAADAADARAKAGISLGPSDGAIVTIKDLFDVAGEPTRAGSKILADAPPAKADAPVVRRLRAAGAVIVAKTAHERVRVLRRRHEPALRHAGQSGGPRARAGRLVVGRGGRGRRPHVRDRDRHRHRRLDPHSGRALRRRRLQAEQVARADRRRVPALLSRSTRSARSRARSRTAHAPTP